MPYTGEPWFMHPGVWTQRILGHPLLLPFLLVQTAWLLFSWIGFGRLCVLVFSGRYHFDTNARASITVLIAMVAVFFLLSALAGLGTTARRLRLRWYSSSRYRLLWDGPVRNTLWSLLPAP